MKTHAKHIFFAILMISLISLDVYALGKTKKPFPQGLPSATISQDGNI